jgi:hypothetical protein
MIFFDGLRQRGGLGGANHDAAVVGFDGGAVGANVGDLLGDAMHRGVALLLRVVCVRHVCSS